MKRWEKISFWFFSIVAVISFVLLLSGCTTKFVWTDDVVGFSGSICSWGKVDDLTVDVNDTLVKAGGSEYRPDANAIEAAVKGAVEGLKKI